MYQEVRPEGPRALQACLLGRPRRLVPGEFARVSTPTSVTIWLRFETPASPDAVRGLWSMVIEGARLSPRLRLRIFAPRRGRHDLGPVPWLPLPAPEALTNTPEPGGDREDVFRAWRAVPSAALDVQPLAPRERAPHLDFSPDLGAMIADLPHAARFFRDSAEVRMLTEDALLLGYVNGEARRAVREALEALGPHGRPSPGPHRAPARLAQAPPKSPGPAPRSQQKEVWGRIDGRSSK